MTRIGKVPAANRYQDMPTDSGLSINFEIQNNLPVDGSSEALRNYSPFRIRTLLPSMLEATSFIQKRLHNLTVSEAVTNLETGDAEAVPKRDVNLFGTANLVYGQNQKVSTGRSLAQRTQQINIDQRVTEKIDSNVADIQAFVLNGKLRNEKAGGYYGDMRFVDQLAAADIAAQAIAILERPPLTLLINPNSFSKTFTQISQYSEKTRKGYIYHAWGEEQPKISFSGQIGAFFTASNFAVPNADGTTQTVSGMQFASKRDSASFQNLMSIFQMFRNNGYIFDRLDPSSANHMIGSLAIEYDNMTYIGHMVSFTYGYSDEKQNGNLEFSLEFEVSATVDSHQGSLSVLPLRSPEEATISPRAGATSIEVWDLESPGGEIGPINIGSYFFSDDLGSSLSRPAKNSDTSSSASTEELPPSTGGFQ